MADEAIIVELLGNKGDPIRYTVADGTGIAKGSVMELTTPRTMKIVSAVDKPICGILASEKVANDGETSVAVYTNGIFQMTCGAAEAAVLGQAVSAGAVVNEINTSSTLDVEKGWNIGWAMETLAGNATGMVRVLK